jgi:hypothetical protein
VLPGTTADASEHAAWLSASWGSGAEPSPPFSAWDSVSLSPKVPRLAVPTRYRAPRSGSRIAASMDAGAAALDRARDTSDPSRAPVEFSVSPSSSWPSAATWSKSGRRRLIVKVAPSRQCVRRGWPRSAAAVRGLRTGASFSAGEVWLMSTRVPDQPGQPVMRGVASCNPGGFYRHHVEGARNDH